MRRTRRTSEDDGTVLLLIVGLVAVAALLVSVVIDVSALYLERRKLIAAVDGAALAGAQAVDEEEIYRHGLPSSGPVALDAVAAETAAREYLRSEGVRLSGIEIDSTSTTVTVRVTSRYDLPVASAVTAGQSGSASVSASARAHTAVMP